MFEEREEVKKVVKKFNEDYLDLQRKVIGTYSTTVYLDNIQTLFSNMVIPGYNGFKLEFNTTEIDIYLMVQDLGLNEKESRIHLARVTDF